MPKNTKLSCSYATQKKMADALKELMIKKPIDKISVSDITNQCGIHRQTFYYHFEDKFELLEWILYNELIEPLVDGFTLDTMYEHFEAMFTTMKNDEAFFKNAFKVGYDFIALYLNNTLAVEFASVLKKIEEETNTPLQNQADEVITAYFVSYGIAGVVHNWAQHGMKESPEELTQSIKNVMSGLKKLASLRQ